MSPGWLVKLGFLLYSLSYHIAQIGQGVAQGLVRAEHDTVRLSTFTVLTFPPNILTFSCTII